MISESSYTVRTDPRAGLVEVALHGEIDLGRTQDLRQLVTLYARSGACDLVVDLDGVTFLDATGLALLVDLDRETRVRGRRMTLRNVPPMTDRLIRVTGLDQLLAHGDGQVRRAV